MKQPDSPTGIRAGLLAAAAFFVVAFFVSAWYFIPKPLPPAEPEPQEAPPAAETTVTEPLPPTHYQARLVKAKKTPRRRRGAPAASAVTNAPPTPSLEAQYGIQVCGMRMSLGGVGINLRYKVLDAQKAARLGDGKTPCYLVDRASGTKLPMRKPPAEGAFPPTGNRLLGGRNLFRPGGQSGAGGQERQPGRFPGGWRRPNQPCGVLMPSQNRIVIMNPSVLEPTSKRGLVKRAWLPALVMAVAVPVGVSLLGGFGRAAPDTAAKQPGRRIVGYQDSMHPWIKSERPGKCTICGMDLTPIYEGEKGLMTGENLVSLGSNAITVLNVQTEEVRRQPLARTLEVAGTLRGQRNQEAHYCRPGPRPD